ncbi:MAG TPA: DUF4162 domain-containing protein, partial [Blastocatellia bacterium]
NFEETLNAHPAVKQIFRRRDHTEVTLMDHDDPQTLLQHLLTNGARITRFELVAPSLNEIFIESVKQTNGDNPK